MKTLTYKIFVVACLFLLANALTQFEYAMLVQLMWSMFAISALNALWDIKEALAP